ncbi:MAG: aspartate kinase [Kiritimatiellae bacterium]|nr:aspartate kinase [Kiritimatiellia bacterium]
MKVCKFGGSSLADAGQIAKVLDIVLADPARRMVVVSAPGKRSKSDTKVTDLLIALAQAVIEGKDVKKPLAAVVARYASIAETLKLGKEIVKVVETDLLVRVQSLSRKEASDPDKCARFVDLMKAAGEDNSAKIVAAAFCARGVKARYASPKDTGMILEGEPGNATLNPESYRKLGKAFSDFEGIVVYPGFFGYRKDGSVATFPRGGSDITGSILAAAARADVYENFTDVDNVYPVDPRIVPEVSEGIDTMTYREMRELAYAGFGVFNDEAIQPAVQARVPINVRNTNRPQEPGTMIVQSRRVMPGTVTGIAAANGFSNIIIDKYLMNREIGFTRKVLAILEEEGVAYEHIPSGIDSISVIIRADKFSQTREKKVVSRIKRELAPDSVIVTRDYAVIMVVGEGMAFSSGMLAKATTALAAHGINISMVNQGASEISFMIGIKSEDRDKAVRALYESFFG